MKRFEVVVLGKTAARLTSVHCENCTRYYITALYYFTVLNTTDTGHLVSWNITYSNKKLSYRRETVRLTAHVF